MTTTPTEASQYTFDNSTPEAGRQLGLLAEILDPHSTDVLTRLGVAPGWRCLDVGSGAGTITGWLAGRVGPDGHVTALDLEPRSAPTSDVVQVRRGDVRTVELPADHFDLIHARLVLMHLADRERVLARLVDALRPGGVMVLSEWECTSPDTMLVRVPDAANVTDTTDDADTTDDTVGTHGADDPAAASEAFAAFQHALLSMATDNGAALDWAGQVPQAMHRAGLIDIRSEVYNRLWAGGEPGCALHISNSRQLEAGLLARGVTARQLHTLRRTMRDPRTLAWSYLMFTTVGRRPER